MMMRFETPSQTTTWDPEIVYDLLNLAVTTDQHMAMLLVSNKPPSQIDLEDRSQSRLGYRTLQFIPYDKEDLESFSGTVQIRRFCARLSARSQFSALSGVA